MTRSQLDDLVEDVYRKKIPASQLAGALAEFARLHAPDDQDAEGGGLFRWCGLDQLVADVRSGQFELDVSDLTGSLRLRSRGSPLKPSFYYTD